MSESVVGIREDRAVLLALAERVEIGSGADDELDGRIFDALSSGDLGSAHEAVLDRRKRPNWLPHYTSSIDAVVTLMKRALPGWYWRVGHGSHAGPWAHLNRVHPDSCLPHDEATSYAKSPPRALIAAVLRALAGKLADANPKT